MVFHVRFSNSNINFLQSNNLPETPLCQGNSKINLISKKTCQNFFKLTGHFCNTLLHICVKDIPSQVHHNAMCGRVSNYKIVKETKK
jgi:hypothetical protein